MVERSTLTTQFVAAVPDAVYDAFLEPDVLLQWLPPAEMTGRLHSFDPRVGGGYRMSLFYPESERHYRGKTAEREDMVDVRFVALERPRRIVQAVTFVTDDPSLQGETTMTSTFEPVAGGTQVAMRFDNLPPGLKPEDNDAGTRLSLGQLARRFAPS